MCSEIVKVWLGKYLDLGEAKIIFTAEHAENAERSFTL